MEPMREDAGRSLLLQEIVVRRMEEQVKVLFLRM
jgi:hypothetical protein